MTNATLDPHILTAFCCTGTMQKLAGGEGRSVRVGQCVFKPINNPARYCWACELLLGIPKGDFPSVSDWAKGFQRLRERFDGATGPFPKRLVDTAEALFSDLLASMDETILLHGDLHHWNILSADREPWLAIDPKGALGEPAYEVGAWLRNPFPQIMTFDQPRKVIARRLDQFADKLTLARDRMLGWGIAQAVLAAWWSFEDEGDWEDWLAYAEIISTVE